MNGIWTYAATLIFLAGFLALLAWTLRLCADDARRRGKSPLLVALLVFVSFPLGLILWLLFRPDPMDGGGTAFRLEDHPLQ